VKREIPARPVRRDFLGIREKLVRRVPKVPKERGAKLDLRVLREKKEMLGREESKALRETLVMRLTLRVMC
jgi:hypothetical protein